MDKADAKDAAPIVQRTLGHLIKTVVANGRIGSNARAKINDTIVRAYPFLRDDLIADPMVECFDLTLSAGATFEAIEQVRKAASLEVPTTVGGTTMMGVCIGLCFSAQGTIISGMDFVSRQDVERIKNVIQVPFQEAEEAAADAMDQATYMALVQLHAAITNFLVETARPLPRMLNYQFASSYPSLVLAYKLYDDASRADEVRSENKIVHPAFCPRLGLALSA